MRCGPVCRHVVCEVDGTPRTSRHSALLILSPSNNVDETCCHHHAPAVAAGSDAMLRGDCAAVETGNSADVQSGGSPRTSTVHCPSDDDHLTREETSYPYDLPLYPRCHSTLDLTFPSHHWTQSWDVDRVILEVEVQEVTCTTWTLVAEEVQVERTVDQRRHWTVDRRDPWTTAPRNLVETFSQSKVSGPRDSATIKLVAPCFSLLFFFTVTALFPILIHYNSWRASSKHQLLTHTCRCGHCNTAYRAPLSWQINASSAHTCRRVLLIGRRHHTVDDSDQRRAFCARINLKLVLSSVALTRASRLSRKTTSIRNDFIRLGCQANFSFTAECFNN